MQNTDTIKRASAVLRVSSAGQTREEKSSIPAQLTGAQAWCDAEDWELVKVYDETADKGFQSGAVDNNDRPTSKPCCKRQGRLFDVVIFKDNTRLGRDKLEAQGMANDLRKAGVPLVGFEAQSRRVLDVTDDMDGMMFDFGQAQSQMDTRPSAATCRVANTAEPPLDST